MVDGPHEERLAPGEAKFYDLRNQSLVMQVGSTALEVVRGDFNYPDAKSALLLQPGYLDIQNGVGYERLSAGERFILGRSYASGLELSANVSREHAELWLNNDVLAVRDLYSSNGTRITRVPLASVFEGVDFSLTVPERQRTMEISVRTAGHMIAHEGHPHKSEDAWFSRPELGAVGVFDGVGGSYGDSSEASRLAADVIQARMESGFSNNHVPQSLGVLYMKELLQEAHQRVLEAGSGDIQTTATVARVLVDEEGQLYAAIGSVGDSRAYLLRGGKLTMLTLDHSYISSASDDDRWTIQETLSEAGGSAELDDDMRAHYQRRNLVTSVLGMPATITINTDTVPLMEGDALILTTDGVHDNLTTSEIGELLNKSNSSSTNMSRAITGAAYNRAHEGTHPRAKRDDITAAVIKIDQIL